MRRLRGALVLATLAALVLIAGCSGAGADRRARSDPQKLPDVVLERLGADGSTSLRSLRGPLVINLWASWCEPCKRELPIYEKFSRASRGVRVIGVAVRDQQASALAFSRKAGVTFPLLADPDGAMRAAVLPKLLLVDGRGRVVHQQYVEITAVSQLRRLVKERLHV